MRSFILNVALNLSAEIEIEDSLEEYYRLIDCRVIDITERTIGGVSYDIVCDDEGLLKSDPIVSALDDDLEPVLFGTLIFLHHDDEGKLTELSEKDVDNLSEHVRVISAPEELMGRVVMTGVNW